MGSAPLQSVPPNAQVLGAVAPPRPLRTLGRVVVVLLVVMVLADAFAVLADVGELAVIDRLVAGEDVPQREIDSADDRFLLAGTVQLVVNLAIVVAWLTWLRRAYADLPHMGAGAERRFGIRWAAGSWFVPILNLWRPKQITNDVWRATEPEPDQSVAFTERSVPAWLAVWWGGWLLVTWSTNLSTRLFFQADGLEDQRSSTLVTLVSDVAWILVDLLAIAVVVAITRRWDARRSALRAGPSG